MSAHAPATLPTTLDLRERLAAALGPGYSVGRELGAGGMARVFAATELANGRRVAVKVLAPALAACCDADRFRREMTVVRSLDHPHVVPLLGECESCGGDRLFYFVMPLVDGETLRARLDRDGALPVDEAVRLLRQIAGALAHAHDRGVVHRDVKPANVLLSNGRALVTDFGVAKAIAESAVAAVVPDGRRDESGAPASCAGECATDSAGTLPEALTGAGFALGTPAYMAPEQALGDPAADHRADLYALGVLAYEMLTGRPPFADRSARALIAAHVAAAPEPVAALRPELPPELSALVMRLLAKLPEDRPRSAHEVLRSLEREAAGGER